MGRPKSRFRISICDKEAGESLKVELIEAPGLWRERRYQIRVNGKAATQVPEATLTEVFDRLRRWMVRRTIDMEVRPGSIHIGAAARRPED